MVYSGSAQYHVVGKVWHDAKLNIPKKVYEVSR